VGIPAALAEQPWVERCLAATGNKSAAAAALVRAERDLSAARSADEEPDRVFFFGEASLAHETACTLRDSGDLAGAVREFQHSVSTREANTAAGLAMLIEVTTSVAVAPDGPYNVVEGAAIGRAAVRALKTIGAAAGSNTASEETRDGVGITTAISAWALAALPQVR